MKQSISNYHIQKKIGVTFFFLFFIVFSNLSQTITFDDQGHADFAFLPNPYIIANSSESFRFTFSNGGAALAGNHRYRTTDTDGCNVPGAPFGYLRIDPSATTWTIETVSGNEIDLGNIRFLNMFQCYSSFVYSITVTGFKNGTSTGSQSFSVTGGNSVFTPNTNFDDVDRVVITGANLASLGIDDVNWVAAAPSATAPIASTTTATSISNTSTTLAGNVTSNGGEAVTERGIVYSITNTNSNPLINGTGVTKDTNGTGTGVFSESISNLSAGTQYSFKAYAINSVGTSYGSVLTFTTSGKGWTGATNTDWTTNTNWSPNSVPISSDNLVIPNVTNKPIITVGTNAIANTITIDASSSLTIKSGGNLTIEGNLIQNGTFSISSDFNSNGSLIVKGTHTGSGTVDYGRYLSTSGITLRGWHLISSPVNGKNITDFYGSLVTNGTKRGIGPYVNTNPTNTKWSYFTTNETPGFFTNGKGYTIKKAIAGTLTFNGFLNTSDVNIQVDATGDNYNAIGNPFTSYINGGTFLDDVPTGILTEKTIWFWDEAGNGGTGEYITSNIITAYKVAPGQGFFVQALATGNVTFSENLQTHIGGNTFLKQENKPEIKVFITDGTNTKSTEIYYIENKTTSFDDGYDSSMFDGFSNPFAIYTQLISDNEGKNLAIQTLPNSDFENMIIPVGITAESGKEITFSLSATNFSSDLSIFLEDRITNTFTRLNGANSEYKVTLTESLSGIGRFYLHTSGKALTIDGNFMSKNISIYKLDESTVRITGLSQGNVSFSLFNVLGKQVQFSSFDTNGVSDISLPKLANGIYIIQLKTANGMLNKKIILE
jgi:hypothetical protein